MAGRIRETKMIERLRPKWTDEELSHIYAQPHDHVRFGRDHILRVEVTQQIANDMARLVQATSAADLSCGNGTLLTNLAVTTKFFGDFAPGYEFIGAIETTIDQIPEVDVFILSETLEHVDDPVEVLWKIRQKAKALVLSTPVGCFHDSNPEHYWAYDREGVQELLRQANWTPNVYNALDTTVFNNPYVFGMWGCV